MAQAETLATILIQACRDQDDNLPALLQDVPDSDIDSLLGDLKLRASREEPDDVVALLRLLLSQPRTCEKAALECIRLIQTQVIKDKAAFRCLPELRAAFNDSFARREGIEKSRPSSLLQNACDIILSFLTGPCSENLDESSQAGHSQALEILPTVLDCLTNESFFLRMRVKSQKKAKDAYTPWTAEGVAAHIVESEWPSQMVLPLLSVVIDADLTQMQQEQACAKVDSGLANVPEAQVSGLVQYSLTAASKFETLCWMNTVRKLLNSSAPNSLRDIFCIIEISLQNGSAELELLLEVFATSAEDITACDVTLLLLIAQNDLCRFTVMETVTSTLLQMLQPSKHHRAEDRQRIAEQLLSEVCQRSEAVWQCSLLLELGSSLMEPHRAGGQALGSHLLSELFHWQPHCRSQLIQGTFTALVEQAHSRDTQQLFLALLKKIAASHLLALRELVEALGHGMALLWLVELEVAREAMRALVPVCAHSRALSDKLLVMFRKEMYGADTARATLAVFGQCQLLAQRVLLEEQEQLDALVALKPVLSAALPVRVHLYAGLSAVLRSPGSLSQGAQTLLQQMLLANALAYMRPAERDGAHGLRGKYELRLLRCFEFHSFNSLSTLRAKESFSGLFECIGGLSRSDDAAAELMGELAAQLTDAHCVLEMLTGEGRGGEAGECDGTKVPLGDRAAVLAPLYELFVASAARTPLPAWAVPAAMRGRGKGARTGGRAEAVQAAWLHIFSTVTAHFPASNGGEEGHDTASHISPTDALVTLERLSFCEGVHGGHGAQGATEGEGAGRSRAGRAGRKAELIRLAPVIGRMVRRAASKSESEAQGLIQAVGGSGEGSVASTGKRAREEAAARDKTCRLAACVARLLRASDATEEEEEQEEEEEGGRGKAGGAEEEEEERAARGADGGGPEAEREDGKDALREDGTEGAELQREAESSGRGRRLALDGHTADMVQHFEATLRAAAPGSAGGGGGAEGRKSLMRLRNALMQALVDCLQSAEGDAVCEVLLRELARGRGEQEQGEGEREGRGGGGASRGRGSKRARREGAGEEARQGAQRRAELATLMLERLSREADEGVHLSALLLGLDLVVATWGQGGGDRRSWQGVCRGTLRLLCRLSVGQPRAWKRALSFAFSALAPAPAALLACRLLSSVGVEAEGGAGASGAGCAGPEALPELARAAVKGLWAKMDGWELPVLAERRAVSAVLSLCLQALAPLLAVPPDWAAVLAGRGSAEERERVAVMVQAVVASAASFRAVREVTSAARGAMLRGSRAAMALVVQMCSSRAVREWEEEGLEVLVAMARAAFEGGEVLEAALVTVQAEAAARCKFMLQRMHVRLAKACAVLERADGESAAVAELQALLASRAELMGSVEDAAEGGEGYSAAAMESDLRREARKRKRKGKRLRSRNAFVDAFLEEEDGGDSYADLEDFIVCTKGSKY